MACRGLDQCTSWFTLTITMSLPISLTSSSSSPLVLVLVCCRLELLQHLTIDTLENHHPVALVLHPHPLPYMLWCLLITVIQRLLGAVCLFQALRQSVSQWVCRREVKVGASSYLLQLLLQHRQHRLLDEEVRFIEILNDELVVVGVVDVYQNGLDGRLTLDEHAWTRARGWGRLAMMVCMKEKMLGSTPLTALTILTGYGDG
jgi:hypothetical protein